MTANKDYCSIDDDDIKVTHERKARIAEIAIQLLVMLTTDGIQRTLDADYKRKE